MMEGNEGIKEFLIKGRRFNEERLLRISIKLWK